VLTFLSVRKKLSDLLVRFRDLVVEYGVIALIVHYAIFVLVIVGFWAAMRAGWEPTGAAGSVGTWTAAYVATKVTQPLRIVATIAITPFIAKIYERVTGQVQSRAASAEQIPRDK
jgi:hypothetical protein